MAIKYKIDVLGALKAAGYNSTRIRNEKIMGESMLQKIRSGQVMSLATLDKVCELLNCQPGDVLEYVDISDRDFPKI
ncbi:MAG: XRE family transcriptional regulator [Ruminococcaceae bacterium]|nr:XRE family transcriptional regulator [Oscillospiraceae bacterium]